jgi:glycerol-3-phosphate dehydrogenase (NAD(P)+)
MELSKKTGVEMPIASELYKILYEDKDPKLAAVELMNRAKKDEHSDLWL